MLSLCLFYIFIFLSGLAACVAVYDSALHLLQFIAVCCNKPSSHWHSLHMAIG